MNTNSKLLRLAVAAVFSSVLWAGCASNRIYYGDATTDSQPVNLLEQRADTYRAHRTGLDDYSSRNAVVGLPPAVVIEEAAGAERP